MTCQQIKNILDEYIDDTLSVSDRSEVQQHLLSCSDCLNEYQEMKELVSNLSGLASGLDPENDLWPGIESRIKKKPVIVTYWPKIKFYLNVAAIVVIVFATVLLFFREEGWPVRELAQQSSFQMNSAIQLIHNEFIETREKVKIALVSPENNISTATRQTIEYNLHIIDEATNNIHQALQENGADPKLLELYHQAYIDQVKLLQKTLEIVNNQQRSKI